MIVRVINQVIRTLGYLVDSITMIVRVIKLAGVTQAF